MPEGFVAQLQGNKQLHNDRMSYQLGNVSNAESKGSFWRHNVSITVSITITNVTLNIQVGMRYV